MAQSRLRKIDGDTRIIPTEDDASQGPVKANRYTLTWQEIPEWQKDNEYILGGYRRVQNHWKGCFSSVFTYVHNETINIHTHLWGGLLFVYLLSTFQATYFAHVNSVEWKDTVVFGIFLVSAIFCLLASSFFHTSTCHSQKVSAQCHALDYSGIVILIVGSFYPCIYYGFFCSSWYQITYLSAISLVGLGAAYIVLNPEYAKPTHRGARTKVFILLGLSAVVPVTHMMFAYGVTELLQTMGFGWLLASGTLYIIGALLYANRIPEKLAPGMFDYWFASHQIFHTCVVLAALAHYECVLTAFDYRHSSGVVC